jgi:hypothetical protein
MSREVRLQLLQQLDNETKHLPGMLPLVANMPLIIKDNIATELGICNGTRCRFSRLVLHPLEPSFDLLADPLQPPEYYLRKAPSMLIVKIDKPRFNRLPGLEEGEFPIMMKQETFNSHILGSDYAVTRTQFPVLPAYAITGYAAQGGTFEQAIVDLRVPEGAGCGPNNLADVYVLLSRVKSIKGLLILRPFQSHVLATRPSDHVFKEIDRLTVLEQTTNIDMTVQDTSEFDYAEDKDDPFMYVVFPSVASSDTPPPARLPVRKRHTFHAHRSPGTPGPLVILHTDSDDGEGGHDNIDPFVAPLDYGDWLEDLPSHAHPQPMEDDSSYSAHTNLRNPEPPLNLLLGTVPYIDATLEPTAPVLFNDLFGHEFRIPDLPSRCLNH